MHIPTSLNLFPVLQPNNGFTPVALLIASEMLPYEYVDPGTILAFFNASRKPDFCRKERAALKKLG
jgi:hypothetical protein